MNKSTTGQQAISFPLSHNGTTNRCTDLNGNALSVRQLTEIANGVEEKRDTAFKRALRLETQIDHEKEEHETTRLQLASANAELSEVKHDSNMHRVFAWVWGVTAFALVIAYNWDRISHLVKP